MRTERTRPGGTRSGTQPITLHVSAENQVFQYVETLQRKRIKRTRSREFVLEGVRPINQAIQHGWQLRSLLYSRERPLSDWAEGILVQPLAPVHYELPARLLAKLSRKSETSELLAVVAMPPDDLGRIPLAADLLVVVCDRPASPGNLGSIIRSCDALGAHGVIVTGHAADLYDPETISATTGSLFAVPVIRLASDQDLVAWAHHVQSVLGDLQIVGTSEKATSDVSEHGFVRPTILVVGNETWGMSARYTELCDTHIRIPMSGSASSLNVASATSIVLYEVRRQRRLVEHGSHTTTDERAQGGQLFG
jgi:TrmH family RNA methyltransferase